MAKRFQPMKEFGRTTKKPKLDLSINKKNRNVRDNVHAPQPTHVNTQSLWDDDEDDVILLASQDVESKIAASKSNENITESEITFSEFEPQIQQHSTQRSTEPQEDLLSQMFGDDDDFVRLAAAVEKDCKKHVPSSAQLIDTNTPDSMIFKKPEPPGSSKSKAIKNPATQRSVKASQNMPSQLDPSVAARRQLATERQVQFLMERLDAVKAENSKLNKDLGEIKDQMQAKSGEASMLRDELRRAKQQVDKFKMEKLLQTEATNAESKLKIEKLANVVQRKESELQLKSMECSVLKMRQADETRQLEMSMCDTAADDEPSAGKNAQAKPATKPRSVAQMLSVMRLRNLTISPLPKMIESTSALLTEGAFERVEDRGVSKKFNTSFQEELETLQLIVAQIQLQTDEFDSPKLIESVRKVFSEFWSYVHTLEYGFYEKVQPYHNYDVMADKSNRTPGCLLLKTALYKKERGINLRRYIATLSAVCQQSSFVTRVLLKAKHEEYPLLQIVIDAIIKLGFSTEISEHFGVIEACAILMRSILLHLDADLEEDKDFFDLIFDLLKYLVFARPNPWTLYELSFTVLDCAHRSLPFLSKFCENSERRHFETNRSKCTYRFSNDACFLQVYCGLMESTFPLYLELCETHFELQTKLCLNHVRFVFNCLTEPPHFVQKMLFLCDEDEENAENKPDCDQLSKDDSKNISDEAPSTSKNISVEAPSTSKNISDEAPCTSKQAAALRANSANSDTSSSSFKSTQHSAKSTSITCDCFTQMCLSVVTMIWLTLRQWLRMDKDFQTPRVGLISRVSVHLLYVMFCDNYHACLFREDEDTTKHYFYLICTWWQENATELKLSDLQLRLLQKLKDCYAMPKLFKDEEVNLDNIKSDVEQWRRVTHDNNWEYTPKDGETIIKNLRLLEDIFDPDIFLASMNKDYLQLKTSESTQEEK